MTTWGKAKRAGNIAKHGVDLALAEGFDWSTALIREDKGPLGEQREVAIGWIGPQLYVYTLRGEADHAISLRRAEPKERRYYAKEV